MPCHKRLAALATVLIVAILTSTANTGAESAPEMLHTYMDLVLSGNVESAKQFWTDEAQRRSSRFGIEYIGVDMKGDCASPLIYSTDLVREFPQRVIRGETTLGNEDYSRVEFELAVGPDTTKRYYYTYRQGDYYWLMYAQDFFSVTWDTLDTRFFRVIYDPDDRAYLNPVALRQADDFIERVCRGLDIGKDDLKLLEREKIYYFFADYDLLGRDVMGYHTKGAYDMASDDIISSFFPHYHEMVHFLVNFKLRRLPLYTLPVMREGLAVYYGGRWGKSSNTLLSLAASLVGEGIVDIDSVLTRQAFNSSVAADMSYPLAGLFTAYLLDKKGMKNYLKLYQRLSGDSDRLDSMALDDIHTEIAATLGKSSWEQVQKDFNDFAAGWLDKYAGVRPGAQTGGEVVINADRFTITRDGDWLSLAAVADSGSFPQGFMVFGFDSSLVGAESWLYYLQYKLDTTGAAYRYGLRFDQYEAGIYDYATSEIVAKYIWGIGPSENYYSEQENKVTFRFSADLVGGALSQDTYRLMPQQ